MPSENTGKNKQGTFGPVTKKPQTGGAYPAQGYNYTWGTRDLTNPATYTRAGGQPLPAPGPAPAPGRSPGGSSRSRGGSYGGGGSGGYGPSAYEQWKIAEEERRRRELEERKAALIAQLTGARDQATPMLQQYGQQYNADIGNIFAQNQGLNAGYGQQLQAIQGQMNQGAQGQQDMLMRDLQGQGVEQGGPEMRALQGAAGQQTAGTDFLSLLAQQYNTRLQQVMAQRQADAQSMGAGIQASSQGQLQNSYANLLAQIGMIGLQ